MKPLNALCLVVAVGLLIVGFPSFLFGVFLTLTQGPDGIGGGFRFTLAGAAMVGTALGVRVFLRRRDAWF